jgi:hypothetical protein
MDSALRWGEAPAEPVVLHGIASVIAAPRERRPTVMHDSIRVLGSVAHRQAR